jgi:geranylgeranyl transferase type-2 subunit beta
MQTAKGFPGPLGALLWPQIAPPDVLGPGEAPRHARAVLRFRCDDGGFSGRRGRSDLYYTSFAVASLVATGGLTDEIAEPLRAFLAGQKPDTLIDQLNLLTTPFLLAAPWRELPAPDAVREFVRTFRTPDGGYGQRRGAPHGSTYHSYLAMLCLAARGLEIPDSAGLCNFLLARRRSDGGFADLPHGRTGQTNATAAALQLAAFIVLPEETVEAAVDYLAARQDATGGWLASDRAPFPDLLSTYSALVALAGAGRLDRIDLDRACEFTRASAGPDGGFGAGPWDAAVDTEYTFYGLGILALAAMAGLRME